MVANTMRSAEARIYALAAEHEKDKEPRRTNNRNVSEETFSGRRRIRVKTGHKGFWEVIV